MNDREFARRARGLGLAWVTLIALMLASAGSAYLKLGMLNTIAGLAIAAVKVAIVAFVFMRIGASSALARLSACVALAIAAILFALAGIDMSTRPREPSPAQPPQQLSSIR